MGLFEGLSQPVERHMRVQLGGGQGGVTEEFLEHMGGGTVSQAVRRYLRDVGQVAQQPLQHGAHHALVHAPATRTEEERPSGLLIHQPVPNLEPGVQGT